jgi:hypothetical protein
MKRNHHANLISWTNTVRSPRHAFNVSLERVTSALADLKRRLQSHYEDLHPDHRELVREIVAEAEVAAWDLSPFPHLLLPDLVQVRMAELDREPAFVRSDTAAFAYAA